MNYVYICEVFSMSFEVSVTSKFSTKTKEQAEYIAKFFADAGSLMWCESSSSAVSEIVETDKVSF